ncbi:MAG: nucleotidyltransferase family protein [Anaerolineae bacterium]|nr:nucleotidyltransferase family protein [Anaerolineae bacterium]
MPCAQGGAGAVEGVILAGGLSTRAGRFKMALPLGDKTVIQRTVESMAAFVRRTLVVVGWQAEVIKALLADYPGVELVYNDDFRSGMFSSIRVGIARVRAPRFFLLPGDQPTISPGVYRHLLASEGEIVVPTCGDRRGHPILLSARLIPEILALPLESTLRDYIRAKGATQVAVDDAGILLDIDTPADYDAILARYEA